LLIACGTFYWLATNDRKVMSNASLSKGEGDDASEIIVLCAASNQTVIEQIRIQYEKETGRKVSTLFGSSQSLLAQLEISKRGDLYLPADDSFLAIAKDKKLVDEVMPIASMGIGLAVKRGNPKQINQLTDLLRDDVRLVLADPDAAGVSKLARSVLEKLGQWDAIKNATITFRSNVTEVAADVHISAADVGIVYEPVLVTFPDLELVKFEEFKHAVSQVSIGVASTCRQREAALHFAQYVTDINKGLKIYKDNGFNIGSRDAKSDSPELLESTPGNMATEHASQQTGGNE
jgi:molybdate transport system substrate-binding protein